MRLTLALAALVFAPSAILPQVTEHAPVGLFRPNTSRNCPVGVTARPAERGGVVQADNRPANEHLAYNIALNALDFGLIQQAEIKLVGIAGWHLIPVGTRDGDSVTEHLTVSATSAPAAQLETTVYTRRLTGVQWVEVESVTYSSGKVWRQTANGVCRVQPGGTLQVTAR